MPNLGIEVVDNIVAACQANAAEAAAALSRTLESAVQLSVESAKAISARSLPQEFEEPGLIAVFRIGEAAAVALLPQSTGLVPAWSRAPDAGGQSKLNQLAHELGTLFFPETWQLDGCSCSYVPHLGQALLRGELAIDGCRVPLGVTGTSGEQGALSLIWPLPAPAALLQIPDDSSSAALRFRATSAARGSGAGTVEALPSYSRSLLRIQVPVSVTLAAKKQSLGRIVELGQGSIIQFEKSCDELLEMEVGGHKVALGEAVKVGDKFGLRISSLVLPGERFLPVSPETTTS